MNELMVYNNVVILERKDGYFNATAMCQACGKQWGHYWEIKPTQEFMEALSTDIVIPISKLVQSTKGGKNQGTWVHQQVAIHLAQWLSPEFAVKVSRIVLERIQEINNPTLALSRGRERAAAHWRRQGKSEEWITKWLAERVSGIDIRNQFTDVLGGRGVVQWGYGACTNAIYEGVLGGKCDEIKATKELARADNLRDHLNRRELSFVRFAEELATMRMEQDDAFGNNQCLRTSKMAAGVTKDAINKAMETAR